MNAKNASVLVGGKCFNFQTDNKTTIYRCSFHDSSILFLKFTNIDPKQLLPKTPRIYNSHNPIEDIFILHDDTNDLSENDIIHQLSLDYLISKNFKIKQLNYKHIYNALINKINDNLGIIAYAIYFRKIEIIIQPDYKNIDSNVQINNNFIYEFKYDLAEIYDLEKFKSHLAEFNNEITYLNSVISIINTSFHRMLSIYKINKDTLNVNNIKSSYTFCRSMDFDKIKEIIDSEICDEYINKIGNITKKIRLDKLHNNKKITPITIKGIKIYYARKFGGFIAQIPFLKSPSLINSLSIDTRFIISYLIATNEIDNLIYKLENLFILSL
jgi:hypothetical protein